MLSRRLPHGRIDPEKLTHHRDIAEGNAALRHSEWAGIHTDQQHLACTVTEAVEVACMGFPSVHQRVVNVGYGRAKRESVEVVGEALR